MKRLAVVILLATLILACNQGKNAQQSTKKDAETKQKEEVTLAKVNGSTITVEDLRTEFNLLNVQAQQMFMAQGGFKSLLQELIKKEMLYQEAKKKNYAKEEEFKKIIDDYRKRVMIGFLLRDEVEQKAKVTDAEVRKYYDDNKKDFVIESDDKGAPTTVEFDAVKDLIRKRLESDKESEVFDEYIDSLKKNYKVDVDEEAFNTTFGNMVSVPPEEVNTPSEEITTAPGESKK